MPDLAPVIGADTTLPVVAVDGTDIDGAPAGRRARRLLRRSSHVLAALRTIGVTGEAAMYASGGPVLGLQTVEVYVRTGEGRAYVVIADTYPRGAISGPAGERVLVAVRDDSGHPQGRRLRYGASSVELDRRVDPSTIRTSLLHALWSALAPQVWDDVTRELGLGRRVDLYRAEPDRRSCLVVDTTGPAGQVTATIDRDGRMSNLMQYTRPTWVRGEGAFGRYLAEEFRTSLDVTHEKEVFGPFVERLRDTARSYAGLPDAA